ncbi:MAG: hypothetical protein ACP5XB_13710 [Isosphaeraceae bacterium]
MLTQAWNSGVYNYYLLTSPLPQGTFDFSIGVSYNGFTVSGNTIDTSGTMSAGLVLTSNMNGVQVTGNTFKGDQTTDDNGSFYVAFGGETIFVTQGSYTNLMILATALQSAQAASITVNYATGSPGTVNQTIGCWTTGVPGTGGSIAVDMPYFNNTSGRQSQHVYLYGYSFPLDPTRAVVSFSLNNNRQTALFAMDLVNTQIGQQPAMAPAGGASAPLGSASPLSVQSATRSDVATVVGASAFSDPATPALRCFAWTATSPAANAWGAPANDVRDKRVVPAAQTIYAPLPAQSNSDPASPDLRLGALLGVEGRRKAARISLS